MTKFDTHTVEIRIFLNFMIEKLNQRGFDSKYTSQNDNFNSDEIEVHLQTVKCQTFKWDVIRKKGVDGFCSFDDQNFEKVCSDSESFEKFL